MPSHSDSTKYTVAWIAVLEIEAEAALCTLDVRHEHCFESGPGDDYLYIGGEINGHNIIIATLPQGQSYGVGAAAALVNQLKLRFPNIWFALLVGVAAGLPNLSPINGRPVRDIRLGDVLVCVPDQNQPGVVHYDLGHDIEGEKFRTSGRQAEAPAIVRSAIRNIRLTKKRAYRQNGAFAQYLRDLQHNDEENKFSCPSQDSDILLSVTVEDQAKRVPRDERERTQVWYGSIGSGNSLIRNPRRRDELRDDYNLIGLEMEAAGVMNSVPTCVIRGVSDYGDGHKSKEWQPYAAAVASVYAKGVLCILRPRTITSASLSGLPGSQHGPNDHVSFRQESATAPQASFLIPFPRDPDFIERKVFGTIVEKCSQMAGRVALVGIGGIGKSQLAIEYCYRVRERSPSTWLFWVHAGSVSRFEEGYRAIARAMKLPGYEDPKTDVLRGVYHCLGEESRRPWVMVLDNADHIEDFFDIGRNADYEHSQSPSARTGALQQPPYPGSRLAQWLPNCYQGTIIITTRSTEVALRLCGSDVKLFHIVPMEADDALSLWRKKLRSNITTDEHHELCLLKDLGYIPLAISQAAAYINHRAPRCSAQRYRELLQHSDHSRSSILRHDEGDLRRDPQAANAVFTTWQTSFARIQKVRKSASELLCLMSFFHSQGIPEVAVCPDPLEEKSSFTATQDCLDDSLTVSDDSDENDGWPAQGDGDVYLEFEDDVQALRDYHLIELNADGNSFDIHALVQMATRSWLHMYKQFEIYQSRFIKTLCKAFPPSGEYEHWERCKPLVAHVEASMTQKPRNPACRLQWSDILHRTGWYLWRTGGLILAAKMIGTAVRVRRTALGEEHGQTLSSLHLLGVLSADQGKYSEAERMSRATLAGCKKALGPEHRDTLTSAYCLAEVLRQQGQYSEAEQLHRQTLASRTKTIGSQHPDTLTSTHGLAEVLRQKGLYVEAERLYDDTLAARLSVLGSEHPDTLTSMHSLAELLRQQGQYVVAERMLRSTLAITGKVLGFEHHDTLTCMHSLAQTLRQQGQYTEAERLLQAVLTKSERVLGHHHPDTLTSTHSLAETLRQQGQYFESEQLLRTALAASEKVLGREHPDTLATMNSLAEALRHQGQYIEAEQILRTTLAASERVLGPGHPETLMSVWCLATLLAKLSHLDEARQLYERASNGYSSRLGPEHPRTQKCQEMRDTLG